MSSRIVRATYVVTSVVAACPGEEPGDDPLREPLLSSADPDARADSARSRIGAGPLAAPNPLRGVSGGVS